MREVSIVWTERKRLTRKLVSTARILFALGMARTFGEYVHSVYDGELDCAVYKWRGRSWVIPTGPKESQPAAAE